jgi:hypothetical protein
MRCTAMYSNELRITTAAMAIIRKWKNTLKLSTFTMFEKASPGDCDMYQVVSSPATAPANAMRPSSF